MTRRVVGSSRSSLQSFSLAETDSFEGQVLIRRAEHADETAEQMGAYTMSTVHNV